MSAFIVVSRISFVLISLFECIFAVNGQFTKRQIIGNKSEFRNATFNDRINGRVKSGEEISYAFHYDFYCNQTWAVYVCISSVDAKDHTPLLVTVRESLHVVSWSVPMQFDVESFRYTEVCHTLCPLPNYFKCGFEEGPQEIYIDLSTISSSDVSFELLVSNFTSFIVKTDRSTRLHLTPAEPKVLEYRMPEGVDSVLIEASSPTKSCMVLAIQDIKCPLYDNERTVEYKGFYQTMTLQSGITVTEKDFKERKFYIILILKPNDGECQKEDYIDTGNYSDRKKNVTVKIKPSLSDISTAWGLPFGVYIAVYVFSFIICCCIKKEQKTHLAVPRQELKTFNETGNQRFTHETIRNVQLELNAGENVNPQNRITEEGYDTLPDAEKTILYVADLARQHQRYLSGRARCYSWNLLTIAVFYGLPVVQLVYINQEIVYLTGNQDLCYYNFLCSHKLWIFSDFNHIYSNVGYVMLGVLFLLLTWRRENLVGMASSNDERPMEPKGIPHHFGLFYAMGLALVMEGVMSASYHVCPNKANFQFDTAFMYVITTMCMLKLYHCRHPDTSTESHQTWMILAIVLFIGAVGEMYNNIIFWVLFIIAHTIGAFIATAKIYYMGRWKLDRDAFKRISHSLKLICSCCSFRPMHLVRFLILAIAVCVNVAFDLYGIIEQPEDFCSFLLYIFIANLALYLFYYTVMKALFKECMGWIPIMYMLLSFIFWISAFCFFFKANTAWEMTPALSREKNKHCHRLHFYDDHDVWHFLSSFALFFSYMVLFTLDDDLADTSQSSINAF